MGDREKSDAVQLCPWVAWWDQRDAKFFGVFHAPDGITFVRDEAKQSLVVKASPPADAAVSAWDDMLIAAAGDVAAWARPGENALKKCLPLTGRPDGQLALHMQLASPGRSWLLGAGSVSENLVSDAEVAPLQRLMNRYCETPLDTLKDMPLHWKHTVNYPGWCSIVMMSNGSSLRRISPACSPITRAGRATIRR